MVTAGIATKSRRRLLPGCHLDLHGLSLGRFVVCVDLIDRAVQSLLQMLERLEVKRGGG
jgi:hypothetical protein